MAKKSKIWNQKRLGILKEYYPKEGSACCLRITMPDGEHMPREMASAKAAQLNLRVSSDQRRPWMPNEDIILFGYYPTEGAEVYRRLIGRTKAAVERRAMKLGLRVGEQPEPWSEEEDLAIRKFYSSIGTDVGAFLNGRSKAAIIYRATQLGVPAPRPQNPDWDGVEEKNLRNIYPYEGTKVTSLMTGKTKASVSAKASSVFVPAIRSPWNDTETELLMGNFNTLKKGIVDLLPGREYSSCSYRYHMLKKKMEKVEGYDPVKEAYTWTDTETLLLQRYFAKEGLKVADRFPRHSQQSVMNKAFELGLTKKVKVAKLRRENKRWTEAEASALTFLIKKEKAYWAPGLLGRSPLACAAYAKKLGFGKSDDLGLWSGMPIVQLDQMPDREIVETVRKILAS